MNGADYKYRQHFDREKENGKIRLEDHGLDGRIILNESQKNMV
jgi:hypothetical protein